MEKELSRNEVLRRAREFVPRWADATYERGESQSFWNEFLHVFGVDRKRVNASFEFATKRSSTGNTGFIDLFWPGVLLVEQKSADRDLDDAEFQARDYLPMLADSELPSALVMSDFKRIRIVRLDLEGAPVVVFPTSELPQNIDRFTFLTQGRDTAIDEEAAANARAVDLMGTLYTELLAAGYGGHECSVFMVRILFLLFGDDTGLWRARLFDEFVRARTSVDGSDTGAQLAALFQILDTSVEQRSTNLDLALAQFPYVNGGLFSERIDAPSFNPFMREALLECCAFDWSGISPAIFGSMFQTIKGREERRAGGEHYTTESNILKTLNPLFLDELYEDFHKCGSDERQLRRFRDRLSQLRFFDPACGCGNFLVVAYRELRLLELSVLQKLASITGQLPLDIDLTKTLRISPDQFFGIEISEWPAEIARAAFFMVDHQANIDLAREFGAAPNRLPITLTATIEIANALHTNWSEFVPASENVYIFGNPPFSGQSTKSSAQTLDTKSIWGPRYSGYLDYVTCWYAKAIDYFGPAKGRWAYVSTNSVCQGEAAAPLWRPILDSGWRCRFAHRSFQWTSEAKGKAGVHVSIVGFDKAKRDPKPILWTYPEGGKDEATPETVRRINPYLTAGPDVLVVPGPEPLCELLPTVGYGNKPTDGGFLILTEQERLELNSDAVLQKYLRPYIGARELLHGNPRWCLWLVDLEPADLKKSPELKRRIDGVRSSRLASKKPATRRKAETPHLFDEIRPASARFLGIPEVSSEHRRYLPVQYFEPDVIASNKVYVAPDNDLTAFAALSSSMFISWMKTIGGRLESRLSFSNTYTYNSFPMPTPNNRQLTALHAAAERLIATRASFPSRSLADIYDARATPKEIVSAHNAIDQVVDRIFGARKTPESIVDRQAILYRAYAKRTGVAGLFED